MQDSAKLKPTQQMLIVFTLALLAIIVTASIFFGQSGFYWTFGSVQFLMVLIHFLVMIQTRNLVYLIPILFYFFVGLTFLPPLADTPGHIFFAVMAALFLVGLIFVFLSKKINWRYREILKLAAKPVKDAADGFTSRPFPSGQAEYTQEEVNGLGHFLLKHVIAYPFFESDRVVLVVPRYMWTYLLFFKRDYDNETYVAFSDSGKVSVRIAHRDYKAYKEELTFDQLCASLGDLFKQFLYMYKKGQTRDIIAWLNRL